MSEKIDILLVDDRTENLTALEAVLASSNYNLIKKKSGDDALRYLLENEPALILMDVQMPDLDGFETAAIIKKSERTREIPIIFITAINKDEQFLLKGYQHGAVDYIYKPYDPHILRSKVSIFADLARKTQRLIQAEKKLVESEKLERERQVALIEMKSLRREQADQRKYRDLVDGIPHGIVWTAEASSLAITFVSPSTEKILGYTLEECISEPDFFYRHIHEEDRERTIALIKKAQTNRSRDFSIEHRLISKDGKAFWFQSGIRVAAKADEEDAFEIRGLSVDITQNKEAETALRQSKDRSDFLAEASLLLSKSLDHQATLARIAEVAMPRFADWYAIHVLDDQHQIKALAITHKDPEMIKYANELSDRYPISASSNRGVPHVIRNGKSELYSNFTEVMIEQYAQDPSLVQALKPLGLASAIIVPLIARGRTFGSMTFVSTQNGHLYSKEDLSIAESLAHRFAVAIDNADLYEQAQAAIRARDEFLSIASHELKTPLTPLILQTQMLMKTLGHTAWNDIKPERVMKMLHTSDRQLKRLSKLVEELLDISRMSIGRLRLETEKFDLMEMIQDVLERFSEQVTETQCTIEIKAPNKVIVEWDRFRFEQVIINLLSNALKYGPGKPINIIVEIKDGLVKLSIHDHGIGIAKEDQARIFDRFERAVSNLQVGGLGLGLYIVTQIIAAHNGKICVQSEKGSGSVFIVELPQHVESQGDSRSQPTNSLTTNLAPSSSLPSQFRA